jgi:hypothetical protein
MPTTYDLIASSTLTTTANTISFTSIPQTYTDLKLIVSSRCDYAAAVSFYRIYVNSTGGAANYGRAWAESNTSTVSGSMVAQTDPFYYAMQTYGTSASANLFDSSEFYFGDYTRANFAKSWVSLNSTYYYSYTAAGHWNDDPAITNLYVVCGNSANFVANSSFYLFGIKKN